MNNAQRMMESYSYASWNYKKTDSIRYDPDTGYITDYGTIIGKIEDVYIVEKDIYKQFVVLSLQRFKAQPNLWIHIKQIARAALEYGLFVIFVDAIDFGFGIPIIREIKYNEYYKNLLSLMSIQKFSVPYEKNVISACYLESQPVYNFIRYYTVSQMIGDVLYCPAEVINLYLSNKLNKYNYISLIEPVGKELDYLLPTALRITFAKGSDHHDISSLEKRDLILTGSARNDFGYKISFSLIKDKNVDKYFIKKGQKDE